MNCKQGDLAIIVRSLAGNEGRIIRCVKYVPQLRYRFLDGTQETKPGWLMDEALPTILADEKSPYIWDCWLRPIRDPGDDAVDEMVKLVPLPTPSEVTA